VYGSTPLLWAVYNHHFQAASALLARGADPNHQNRHGSAALELLCDTLQSPLPLDTPTAPPTSPAPAHAPLMVLARQLLKRGATLDRPGALADKSVLIKAAARGPTDLVEALVAGGASLEATDATFRSTALLWAVWRRRQANVAVLLDAGANVEAANKFGETVLMLAARTGQHELIKPLLTRGADPVRVKRSPQSCGTTCLLAAVSEARAEPGGEHVKVVSTLLREIQSDSVRRALLTHRDGKGHAALHCAALAGPSNLPPPKCSPSCPCVTWHRQASPQPQPK
jgi:ankyrin repeat protein